MNLKAVASVVGFGVFAASVGGCSVSADEEDRVTDTADNLTANESAETTGPCNGGRFHCYARVVTAKTTNGFRMMATHSAPSGLGAPDLAAAYDLDTSVDPKATVAIVDAYGYKNAEADLKVYRAQYGLPPCTVANGCLTIVNQNGQKSPLPPDPPSNDDWTVETALDLDLASAACPKCKILLIQADDDQGDGLFIAQATAHKLGATVVSNSWGQSESAQSKATDNEHFFQGLGNMGIFVAAGDSGYDNGGQGPDYPSTSAYAIAVGGTKLKKSSSARGWSETAWSGNASTGAGGSSCSLSIPKPAYQNNITTKCNFRANSDVAAVGDPASGPAVYNAGQWQTVGGTSAASPFVAAVFALTGHGGDGPAFAYENASAFNDVTSGTNGTCGNVLCKAGSGWDGPTGVGTPDGKKLSAIKGGGSSSGGSSSGGSSSGGSSSGGSSSGGSSSGGTCGHDICTSGGKLSASCDSCVTEICKSDSYCCKTKWDATCVKEVASICGQSTCN